jgi:hypothetical protein
MVNIVKISVCIAPSKASKYKCTGIGKKVISTGTCKLIISDIDSRPLYASSTITVPDIILPNNLRLNESGTVSLSIILTGSSIANGFPNAVK